MAFEIFRWCYIKQYKLSHPRSREEARTTWRGCEGCGFWEFSVFSNLNYLNLFFFSYFGPWEVTQTTWRGCESYGSWDFLDHVEQFEQFTRAFNSLETCIFSYVRISWNLVYRGVYLFIIVHRSFSVADYKYSQIKKKNSKFKMADPIPTFM